MEIYIAPFKVTTQKRPSRLLLRSAPDPCTAKKKSFEARVECVKKNDLINYKKNTGLTRSHGICPDIVTLIPWKGGKYLG